MADYDIGEAFQRVEEEMIDSMIRNMKHHITVEKAEGLNYAQWQAEQLAALNEYKKRNAKEFGKYFSTINKEIDAALQNAYKNGGMDQEIKILEAIKKGFVPPKVGRIGATTGDFFKINDRRMKALLKSTQRDMKKAETAMLRMANDEYRKTIFNAGVYYDTGAGTLEQCVDMASKDYLARGINCIEYANGRRVPIDTYAAMALRTNATRSYLAGEATMRDEWGVNTVIVNKRGVACPRCLQWVGRVYYDDVWGTVPVTDDKYPRLSTAIQGGLYHPNCKDSHTTYFEGINSEPTPMTKEQEAQARRVYDLEQQQRYNERNIRKYKRLRDGSLDEKDKEFYAGKTAEWEERNDAFVKAHGDVLKRRYNNEKIHGITSFTPPPVAPKITPPTIGDAVKFETANKNYTLEQLNAMSDKSLDDYVRKITTEYYKSGKSGISFGGQDIDEVVDKMMVGQSRSAKLKSVKSMQTKLKNMQDSAELQAPTVAKVKAPKVAPDNFPSEFTSTAAKKKQTQLFADKLNAAENADPKTVELFHKMGNNNRIDKNGVPLNVTYTESNHKLVPSYRRSTGELAQVKLQIPKLSADNANGFGTVCHENGHLLDLLHGSQHTGLSETNQRLIDAIKKYQTNPTIGSDIKTMFDEFDDKIDEINDLMSKKYTSIRSGLTDAVQNHEISWSEYKKLWNRSNKDQLLEADPLKRGVLGGGIDGLQDIYDALSGGRFRESGVIRYGHGARYYGLDFGNAPAEIWANYVSLTIERPDLVQLLKEDKPELVEALEALRDEMLKGV